MIGTSSHNSVTILHVSVMLCNGYHIDIHGTQRFSATKASCQTMRAGDTAANMNVNI
jgi:hypothetical protein